MFGGTSVSNPGRADAIHRMAAVNGSPRRVFDRLTTLAAELIEAPVALLTLVDTDRQFFLSSSGLPEPMRSERQTPLEYSICQYALDTARPLIVGDTHTHPILATNKAVVDLGVAAYAGIPLVTEDDQVLGTFCVLDFRPRNWTADELAILANLAAITMEELNGLLFDHAAGSR
jgi:GAF domain-containing protein